MTMYLPRSQYEQEPSTSQKFSQAIGAGLEMGQQRLQEKNRREAIEKIMGRDVANLPPEFQEMAYKAQLEKQNKLAELSQGKPLNELQQAQRDLALQRTQNLQGQQDLFNQLLSPQQKQPDQPAPLSEQTMKDPQDFNINNPQTWNEDQLKKMSAFSGQPGQSGIIGNIAEKELNRRKEAEKEKRKIFVSDRAYHTDLSKKSREEVEGLRNSLPTLEASLDYARNAVESGEVGAFSLANLGKRLKLPELQTAKGAQLVTAAKENLLSNMNRVSAKAQNQWFEQRMNSMLAQVGQTQEANLSAQEMLESELAMKQAYVNEYDRLAEEDQKNYGYVKEDISKRAHNASKTLEKHIFNRSNYRLKEIEEQEQGLNKLKEKIGKNVIKGTPLTFAMAKLYNDKFGDKALQVAEKNGYSIPTLNEWKAYQERPREFREGL